MPTTKPTPSYHVAFDRLLPVLLRRGKRLRAWLTALLSPLTGKLYPDFLALVAQSCRELTYNGQTIVLEAALNDRFDPNSRRIEIRNDDVEVLRSTCSSSARGRPCPPCSFAVNCPTPGTKP